MIVPLLLVATGCGLVEGPANEPAGGHGGQDGIVVSDSWARPTPPDFGNTAAYGSITNNGTAVDRLTEARADGCGLNELHRTVTDGHGVARMRPAVAADLTIEPGAALELEPNGLHLMCMGLKEPLVEGTTIQITFEFASGTAVVVDAPVRSDSPAVDDRPE